jgi:hypothetical protein
MKQQLSILCDFFYALYSIEKTALPVPGSPTNQYFSWLID